jgi:predicted amidohydrolase YtcJ
MRGGALLASGSDFPVEPPDPLFGIHAAVTRQDRSGEQYGGDPLSLEEAIRSFTIAGARASFTEQILGSIEPGKLADFVVLGDDIFEMDPGRIHEVGVVMTVVGGEAVFEAAGD